jgi:hypothetical protein
LCGWYAHTFYIAGSSTTQHMGRRPGKARAMLPSAADAVSLGALPTRSGAGIAGRPAFLTLGDRLPGNKVSCRVTLEFSCERIK